MQPNTVNIVRRTDVESVTLSEPEVVASTGVVVVVVFVVVDDDD